MLNTPASNNEVIFALEDFPSVEIDKVESNVSWCEKINGRDVVLKTQAFPASSLICFILSELVGHVLRVYAIVTYSVCTALHRKQTTRATC
jgi:hypothetical protein